MDFLPPWLGKLGPQTTGFVSVILVLTLLSGAALAWEGFVFVRERRRLAALRRRLESPGEAASPGDWMVAALVGLPGDGYVRERVASIHELTRQHAPVELSALSDLAVEKSETSLPHNLARFSLLALLIIGLAGTFLALSATLTTSQLDKVAEGGSFDAGRYQQAVRSIYTGFGGAFTNSIFAIVGTVLLLFLQNVVVRPVKDGFFNALDTFTQVRLLPFCLSARQEPESLVFAAVSKLEAVVVHFRAAGRQLGEAVAKSDAASQQLGEFSQSLAEAVRSFAETVGGQSGFQTVMERLYDTLSRSEERTARMLAEFSGVAATVQEENVTLAHMQQVMAEFQKATVATHREFLAKVDARGQSAAEKLEERSHRAAERLDGRQLKHQEALAESTGHMTALLTDLKPVAVALQAGLAREEGRQQALDDLKATLGRLDAAVGALHQAFEQGREPAPVLPTASLAFPRERQAAAPPEQSPGVGEMHDFKEEMAPPLPPLPLSPWQPPPSSSERSLPEMPPSPPERSPPPPLSSEALPPSSPPPPRGARGWLSKLWRGTPSSPEALR